MAKDWAKVFYNSVAWLKCRTTYILLVNGLCERCISPTPGYIVHHKVELNPQNINDPTISLNHELLEYLCMDCHNKEHHGSHEEVTVEGVVFDEKGNLVERARI